MTEQFVKAKRWSENWLKISEVPSGAQGDSAVVKAKRGSEEPRFLKQLKSGKQRVDLARQRFSREATAYATYVHPRIPRLIESNSHQVDDLSCALYLVTEFVPGATLRKYIRLHGPLSVDEGLLLTANLAEVVGYLHSQDCIHRDIKPDNIVLRGANIAEPVLVDFGLSYVEPHPEARDLTFEGEELGNRFLRLPEMSAHSSLRHDVRSDISFVTGILFYVLTAHDPTILADAMGQMPHQRKEARERIIEAAGRRASRLLLIFDRGFAPNINDRFGSIQELLEALKAMGDDQKGDVPPTAEELARRISERLDSAKNQRLSNVRAATQEAVKIVTGIGSDVAKQHGRGLYQPIHVTPAPSSNSSHSANFGFRHTGDHEHKAFHTITAAGVGDELVVTLGDKIVLRTDLSQPDFHAEFRAAAALFYLNLLADLADGER